MHVYPQADFRTKIAILCPWEAIPQEVGIAAASSLSPNEKRGAEGYATTSMSIVMATMAPSMPQFGPLMILVVLPMQNAIRPFSFVAGIDMIWHQMRARLAIAAAFFTIALRRFRKPSFKRRDGFL
jgi:hypothetical protein